MLMTSKSLNSSAVRKELAFAARKTIPVIPVELQIHVEEDLPDWFTLDYDELHRHFIDPKQYKEDAQKLAVAIRTLRKIAPDRAKATKKQH